MFWKNMSGNARCEFGLFLSFHVEQGLEAQSRLKTHSVFASTEDIQLTCTTQLFRLVVKGALQILFSTSAGFLQLPLTGYDSLIH